MPPRVTLQRLHARDPATMLALLTFIKLRRAGNTINAILAAPLVKEHNLTESQFGVLEALWHVGPMAQARLCEKLLVSGSNLTTVIDNLEKRGLVVRGPNPDDRRAYLVRLSPKGEALIAKAFPRTPPASPGCSACSPSPSSGSSARSAGSWASPTRSRAVTWSGRWMSQYWRQV
jgi:MarR family 2-MHQ and catechol resistance regulon transcriptional repressor